MDVRRYCGGPIMADDVREGSITTKIIGVFENSKHNCLVLELENGSQFYLFNSNARILSKVWGWDSEDWIEKEIEFSLGSYLDRKEGLEKETVVVRAISPAKTSTQNGGTSVSVPPAGAGKRDMDDEIPFAPEWR
jgi:hypothetical protein